MKTTKKTILKPILGNMKLWLVMLLLGWASTAMSETWDGASGSGSYTLKDGTTAVKNRIVLSGNLTLTIPAGKTCWITRASNYNQVGGNFIFEVPAGKILTIKREDGSTSGVAIIDGGCYFGNYNGSGGAFGCGLYGEDGRALKTEGDFNNFEGDGKAHYHTDSNWLGCNGGLIYVHSAGYLDLRYTYLQNQYNDHRNSPGADGWGGAAIYAGGSAGTTADPFLPSNGNKATIKLTECTIRGCRDEFSGIVSFSGRDCHSATFTNVKVYYNYSTHAGEYYGIIYCSGESVTDLTVDGGDYHHNWSGHFGGCFAYYPLGYINDKYGSLTIKGGAIIHDNYALSSGGGLFVSGIVHIQNAKIHDNTAGHNGGGIDFYCYGDFNDDRPISGRGVQATIYEDVEIYGNKANGPQGGGGIYAWFDASNRVGFKYDGSSLSAASTEISKCYVNIYGAKIYGNKAENGFGGGVLIEDYMPKKMKIGGVTSNEFERKVDISIRNSNVPCFYSNTAKSGGGGVCIRKLASNDDAAAYNTYGAGELSIKIIGRIGTDNNLADKKNVVTQGNGGGVYIKDEFVDKQSIIDCLIEGGRICYNTATWNGGGVYISTSQDNIDKNKITIGIVDTPNLQLFIGGVDGAGNAIGNQAQNGGGVFIDKANRVNIVAGLIASNNKATNGNGGGFYVKDAILSVTGGSVYSNSASSHGGGFYIGGSKTASFRGCTIGGDEATYANTATNGNGGGICYNSTGALTIGGANATTQIKFNKSTGGDGGNGGGVFVGSADLTVTNTTVRNNTATTMGGGISVIPSSVSNTISIGDNVNDVFIFGNKARSGGGLYVSRGDVTIKKTSVYGNEATAGTGGGVRVGNGLDNSSNLRIQGCIIGRSDAENKATSNGGGICFNSTGTLTIGNVSSAVTRIDYNKSTGGNGGGVWVGDTQELTVTNTIISHNSATNSSNGVGGGICVTNSESKTISIGNNVAIYSNSARTGGGLYVNRGTVNIGGGNYNTSIYGNTADEVGGGVRIGTGTLNVYQNAYIGRSNGYNSGNTANNGGGVYVDNAEVVVTGGFVCDNTSSNGNGGGFYIGGSNPASFSGCTIGNNDLGGNKANHGGGGGIYYNSSGDLTINGATISKNTTGVNGGGINIANGKLTMENGTISDNEAGNGGGGIFVSTSTKIYLNGGRIEYNSVGNPSNGSGQGGGGVLVWDAQEAHFNGVTITNNSTYTRGGGLYVRKANAYIKGTTIIANNEASFDDNGIVRGNGGGVFLQECTIDYDGSGVIEGNVAKLYGGGVYIDGSSAFNMKNSILQNNTAGSNGGGVYVCANGTFTMWGVDLDNPCKVIGNTAVGNTSTGESDGKGGGVYHQGTTELRGLVLITGNTGGRTANNMYLDQSGTNPYSFIHPNGLLCGSLIGINNKTDELKITEGRGANGVSNAQYAFRNEFFFSDSNDYGVFTSSDGGFNFGSNSLYLYPADTRSVFYDYATTASEPEDFVMVDNFITQVKTAKGLAYLAYDVNKNEHDYSGRTVTLEDTITIPSDKIWEPIGHRTECKENPFSGTFDGKFHTINGVRSEFGYLDGGLFGFVDGGTIKNVLVESGSGSQAVNLGGLVGYLRSGTVYNCEAQVSSLTGLSDWTEYVGGLVGYIDSDSWVHSCCAMPGTISGGDGHGGLAGSVNGSLENSFAYTSATNSLCDFGFGSVENCYLRAIGSGFSFNSGDYTHCYANVGTADGSNGVFGSTQRFDGKYGFNPIDQQVTGGDADYVVNGGLSNEGEFGGLLATLNKWVDEQPASMGYSRWTRTMASPINDDYPVLMFNEAVCVGSRDNVFLDYATDLNPMIQAYNNVSGGGDIYLYDVTSEINQNTGSDVRVYINENIGVLQATGNTINARVGVTLDNSDGSWLGGAPYDWHMFSSALTAANMGLEYHSGVNDDYYVKNNYSTLSTNGIPNSVYNNPSCMDPTKTTWSNTNIGYFPTNTPYGTWRGNTDPTGSFDFYCYSEPYVHWINFKREGVTSFYDHWQQNEDAGQMHQNIPYLNESTMEQGKGYMVALSQTSMLMADGVLNNGDSNGEVTRNVTATDVGNILYYDNELQGVNLIGNPFQSYLNFDEFYNENDINTYYIVDADAKKYIAYTAGQSDPVAPKKLHPHQGFFVKVDAGDDVTFTPRMRYTTGGTFRDDDVPHYPLVNLNVADAQGRNDYTTIELERPEAGGGEKAKGLRTGDASVWFHLDNIDWQTAFTVPGLHEAPVRFKAYADGMFTMTWETRNASFSYMHLIDNKTGMDVDCLSQSEYRFEGKTTDYLSRFRLVFEFTGVEEEEEAVETETFAFMMGDELVVNGGPSTGSETAMLQLFDLNGRCVYATELYDMQSIVTLPKMSAGVYILRLTGSKSTRTQKMVIK